MNAYAVTLNNGGAAHVLEVLEPTPINAEEDTGSVALFQEQLDKKATEKIDGKSDEPAPEAEDGADFAAQFALSMKKWEIWH